MLKTSVLNLQLSKLPEPKLQRTQFSDRSKSRPWVAELGSEFRWSKGVMALTAFLLRWAAWDRLSGDDKAKKALRCEGHQGSFAASVNYALGSKWLPSLFGNRLAISSHLKWHNRDFATDRKRPVSISFYLDEDRLPIELKVFKNEDSIESSDVISQFADAVEQQWRERHAELIDDLWFKTADDDSCKAGAPEQTTTQIAKVWYVPELPAHYLPRSDQLEHAIHALVAGEAKPIVVSGCGKVGFHGMGGIGKTVLAVAVARNGQVRARFPDGVFWITVGQYPHLVDIQTRLARCLGDSPSLTAVLDGKQRLGELLANTACLLVLDDVWQADHARAFDALGPQSRMLITTREGSLITVLEAEEHKLDLLTDEEALRLLKDWSGQTTPNLPGEALEVARECGNLPLALAVCGAMVRDGIPWTDLRDALKEADLAFIEKSDLDYTYPNVYRALKVSVDFLYRSDPDGAKRYLELAVFPKDERIPEAAVLTLWCRHGDFKKRDARRLLSTMARKALLRLEGEFPNWHIELHDLQHDFIRIKYETE